MQFTAASFGVRTFARAADRSLTLAALSAAPLGVSLLSVLLCGCGGSRPAPAAAVEASLDRRTSLDVADAPLGDVLTSLLDDAEIPLVNRAERRWPTNYRRGELVTLRLADVRLESALRWLLLPRGLDYVVAEEPEAGLRIVGRDDAGDFSSRTYPVADIAALDGGWCDEAALAEALVALLKAQVEVVPSAVVVVGPPELHRRTARLLADIRAAADPRAAQLEPLPTALSAEDERLAAALDTPTTVDLREATREEAVAWLRGHGLNVMVESAALSAQARRGGPRLAGVPLRQVLDCYCREQNLRWHAADEAICLTVDSADEPTRTVVYPGERWFRDEGVEEAEWNTAPRFGSRWIFGDGVDPIERRTASFDDEDLASLLTEIVPEPSGANGETARAVPGGIAVTQARQGHGQVAAHLAEVDAMLDPYRLVPEAPSSPAAAELERALDRPVAVDWREQPLMTAVLGLQAQVGIENVVFDRGIVPAAEGTVTLFASGISLRAALSLVLEQLGLGWINEQGVLRITTRDGARQALLSRCYRARGGEAQQLASIVTDHADPDLWSGIDHTGARALPGGLLVVHNAEVQREVARLVAQWKWLQGGPREVVAPEVAPESVVRLRAALATPVTVDVQGRPLDAFLADVAREHEIPIVRGAAEFQTWAAPVSGRFVEVQLGHVLRHLLAQHGLDWSVRHEVLSIGLARSVRMERATRVFAFAPDGGADATGQGLLARAFAGSAESIWQSHGGRPEAVTQLRHGVVVTAPAPTLDEMQAVVADLRMIRTPPTPAEERIARELAAPCRAAIVDVPWEAALELLARAHDVAIVVEAGAETASRNAVRPRQVALPPGLTLEAALDRLLRPRGLAWTVRDEAIVVANQHDAAALFVLRAYPAPEAMPAAWDEPFVRALLSFCAAAAGDRPTCHVWRPEGFLVVRQSQRAHAALAEMLTAGETAFDRAEAFLMRARWRGPLDAESWRAALDDPSLLVRTVATHALWDADVVRLAVERLDRQRAIQTLAALLEREAASVQAVAAELLGGFGPDARVAAPRLAEILRDATRNNNPVLLSTIVPALDRVGGDSAAALAEMLWTDHDFTALHLAMFQLQQLGPRARPALPDLVRYLRQFGHSLTGAEVARTLGTIGPDAAAAVPDLAAVLDGETTHRESAEAACRALGAICARPDVSVPALIAAVTSKRYRDSPPVRAAACEALAAFAVDDDLDRIAVVLTAAMDDPFETVARAAEASLRRIAADSEPRP